MSPEPRVEQACHLPGTLTQLVEVISWQTPKGGIISGLFSNLQEAIVGIHENEPDIALLDEAFQNGLAAVGQIRCIAPQILVVAIAEAGTAEEVISWADAGAAGYISSTASLSDMCRLMVEIRLR